MSEAIVARDPPAENEAFGDLAAFMSDFKQRKTISKAAKDWNLSRKVLAGAIERGELRYVILPGSAQKAVLDAHVREWVESYCIK